MGNLLLSKTGKVGKCGENPSKNIDFPPLAVYNVTISGIGTGTYQVPAALLLFRTTLTPEGEYICPL